MRRNLTTALDLLGLACLVACAFFIWPPAALGVARVGLLVGSWSITSGRA